MEQTHSFWELPNQQAVTAVAVDCLIPGERTVVCLEPLTQLMELQVFKSGSG